MKPKTHRMDSAMVVGIRRSPTSDHWQVADVTINKNYAGLPEMVIGQWLTYKEITELRGKSIKFVIRGKRP